MDEDGFRKLMAEQRARAKADAAGKKTGHGDQTVYRAAAGAGPDRVHRLHRARRRGARCAASCATASGSSRLARATSSRSCSTARRSTPSPVARSPTPARSSPATPSWRCSTCRRSPASCGCTRCAWSAARSPRASTSRPASTRSGASAPARATRARTSCTPPCARCSARRRCRAVRTTSPATCGSTSPGPVACPPRPAARSRRSRTSPCARTCRSASSTPTWPAPRTLGAVALFGETYDETVRVIEIGGRWSRELCGGTHVEHSSQIGPITLLGESSVGSGVRRLEAYVGIEAMRFLASERALVQNVSEHAEGAGADGLPERIESLVERLRSAEKELEKAARRPAARLRRLARRQGPGHRADCRSWPCGLEGVSGNDLRTLGGEVRNRLGTKPGVVALFSADGDKVSFVVATTAAARDLGIAAGKLVPVFGPAIGGRGGGKPRPRPGRRHEPGRCPRGHHGPDATNWTRCLNSTDISDVGDPGLGRRLGVDVGSVRVGVSLSDPTAFLATPLVTLQRDEKGGSDLTELVRLVAEHDVVEIVVGLPKTLSGAARPGGGGGYRVRCRLGRTRRPGAGAAQRRTPDDGRGEPGAGAARCEGQKAASRGRPGCRCRDPAVLA